MESSLPSLQIQNTNNDEDNSINASKYKDVISTFPNKTGWNKASNLCQYQGFWIVEKLLPGIMSVQEQFPAKSNDIIVASFPKTGTTWLKALTFAITTRKRFDDSTNPLFVKVPHDCVPFLEIDLAGRDPEIPLISTHLPYTLLPNSIVQEGCKIIYIWRDAKDTFVSLWHFTVKLFKPKGIETISMEEAFELFCQGVADGGSYWDHVLSYWKARQENSNKVLFLKYEEMMNDTAFYVKKLAEFMGCPFTKEEENGVLQKIVEVCSFEKLSKLEVNKNGHHLLKDFPVETNTYFRKAEVGDWSNHLPAEMGARLDLIMENKLKDSGLTTGVSSQMIHCEEN